MHHERRQDRTLLERFRHARNVLKRDDREHLGDPLTLKDLRHEGRCRAASIEVHDADELARASALKSPLLGINNRNLKTFETTLETTKHLARRAEPDRLLVSESGLSTPADLAEMARYGARCFLIGESLIRQADVAAATRALLANPLTSQGN